MVEDQDGLKYVTEDQDCIFTSSNDEFRKYMENPNPTFEDLRNAVKDNQNIQGKYKNWLMEYIDQKEKNFPETDLVCLYYNIKQLEIQEKNSDELDQNTSGYFNIGEHVIVIADDIQNESGRKSTFQHECEHMLHNVSFQADEKNIQKSTFIYMLDENKSINHMGTGLEEGLTEYLKLATTGKESNTHYIYKELQDIVQLYDIVLEEVDLYYLGEHSVRDLISEMKEAGIEEPETLIDLMDVYKDSISQNIEVEENIRAEIYETFLTDITQSWLEEDISLDEIYARLIHIFEQGYIEQFIGNVKEKDTKETTDTNENVENITKLEEILAEYWTLSQDDIHESVFSSINQLVQENNIQETILSYQEAKNLYGTQAKEEIAINEEERE